MSNDFPLRATPFAFGLSAAGLSNALHAKQERAVINAGVPGFRRRIELYPSNGAIDIGLEDDFHRFLLRITHQRGVITGLDARAERYPWSTCPQAGTFLANEVIGRALVDLAGLDAHSHCTHLFELVVLGARHASDGDAMRFEMFVADRDADKTSGTLAENGSEVLRWEISGTTIQGPATWKGRDLRSFARWRGSLTPPEVERAMLLRRASHISQGRQPKIQLSERAVDRGASRIGACFTYQIPRVAEAFASTEWRRDFTHSSERLLEGYCPGQ